MKKQVIIIHGGDVFATYDEYIAFLKGVEIDFERMKRKSWKSGLSDSLGGDYEVILPKMPNSANAKYLEWKIWFEKLIPHFEPRIVLAGHSLGGIFLAKYFSENNFRKEIIATFLVAAPFSDEANRYSLADFSFSGDLKNFSAQAGKIFLYYSEDDDVVPFGDLDKYRGALPSATARVFKDRGHFSQSEFPELVLDIKNVFGGYD